MDTCTKEKNNCAQRMLQSELSERKTICNEDRNLI